MSDLPAGLLAHRSMCFSTFPVLKPVANEKSTLCLQLRGQLRIHNKVQPLPLTGFPFHPYWKPTSNFSCNCLTLSTDKITAAGQSCSSPNGMCSKTASEEPSSAVKAWHGAFQFSCPACPPSPFDHLPPVTSRNVPVIKEASSLASQRMALATSSGWPPLPIGMVSFTRSTRPGSPPLACISV